MAEVPWVGHKPADIAEKSQEGEEEERVGEGDDRGIQCLDRWWRGGGGGELLARNITYSFNTINHPGDSPLGSQSLESGVLGLSLVFSSPSLVTGTDWCRSL